MKKMSGLLGSYGEFATSGQDQRINKKTKPVNQAGGPNYLGKAEMVTVPKQWLSSPDHVVAELAYITPAEQKILIDANLYGSLDGKPNRGPGGLMSLQGDMGSIGGDDGNDGNDGGSGGTPGLGGSQDVGSGFAGPTSGPSGGGQDRSGMQEALEAYAAEQAAAQAAIDQDIAEAEAIRADQARMAADLASRPVAGLTRDQYNAMPSYMRSVYDTTGAYSFDFDDTGRVTGFTGPSVLGFTPGIMGLLTSFAPPPTTEEDLFGVYTGFGRMGEGEGPEFGGGDGPDTVPAEYNPVTGQQNQCPDGYTFDEDLQACRMSADLPFGTPITTPGPYAAGDYARMGLLDIAPMGMSLFADRYGIPQMDFDTANLAFRRAGATRPQYFRKAPDLTGYTLLA